MSWLDWALGLIATAFVYLLWLQLRLGKPHKPSSKAQTAHAKRAYLVATIDTVATPPTVVRVGVFSCPGHSLTTLGPRECNVDMHSAEGESFELALARLGRDLQSPMGEVIHGWATAMLSERERAYMQLDELQGEPKERQK